MRQTEHFWRQEALKVEAALLQRMPENKVRPRLEPTRRAVDLLGNPQRAYRVIHVTGTNGKTSTTRFIERILRELGLRTGRFTSPHLLAINERISIDGEPIDNESLVTAWAEIEPILKLVDEELIASDETPLTYFEALAVLAFAVFADAPIDVLALEVGMGGEWDSTNVADGDVAVFTPIALDHTDRLGHTLEEIATTKSGIIKPDSKVVIGYQRPEAQKVLESKASSIASASYSIQADFQVTAIDSLPGAQKFSVRGLAGTYEDLVMPVLGDFQVENAAVAIASIEAFFGDAKVSLGIDVLRAAFADVASPGRMQIVDRNPLTVLDAAHNPAGISAMLKSIQTTFSGKSIHAVISVLADKDADSIVKLLAPQVKTLTIVSSSSPRALGAEELSELAKKYITNQSLIVTESVDEAFDRARGLAIDDPNSFVLVTGSISLVSDVLKIVSEVEDDDA